MLLASLLSCRSPQRPFLVYLGASGISMDMAEPVKMSYSAADTLTMQIIVRRDLLDAEKWGIGPLMAQAAHAATAVLHHMKELEETKLYLSDLPNMRKVVLQTTNESSLATLARILSTAEPPIPHYLWMEQPENVPTCLALAPNRREPRIKKALDKAGCRLWKS